MWFLSSSVERFHFLQDSTSSCPTLVPTATRALGESASWVLYTCMRETRQAEKNPCGLANRDTYFCGYVRDTEFSAYVEGKKEGDNFSIIDSCLYVSTDLLIHPWPFSFSLFWNSLCFNLRVSFYIVKYFL